MYSDLFVICNCPFTNLGPVFSQEKKNTVSLLQVHREVQCFEQNQLWASQLDPILNLVTAFRI